LRRVQWSGEVSKLRQGTGVPLNEKQDSTLALGQIGIPLLPHLHSLYRQYGIKQVKLRIDGYVVPFCFSMLVQILFHVRTDRSYARYYFLETRNDDEDVSL